MVDSPTSGASAENPTVDQEIDPWLRHEHGELLQELHAAEDQGAGAGRGRG
jgi:hypothetical protein